MAAPLGAPGDKAIELDFRNAPFDLIPPETVQPFGELVIVTGQSMLRVGEPDSGDRDRRVLTSIKGRENHCLILFRHAYGTVTCEFGVHGIAADAHVGFLQHSHFKEVRTFSYTNPGERRQRADEGFWTTLRYSAKLLNELQGIVWRGGTLCFERITLEP